MGELEDKLNSILSSPAEMEKIMGIARSLSQSSFSEPDRQDNSANNESERTDKSDLFGGIDPKMLTVMTRLMGSMNNSSSEKAAVINTIKPFLKKERQQKLDEAAKLARMAKLAKIAFSEFSGGEQDV